MNPFNLSDNFSTPEYITPELTLQWMFDRRGFAMTLTSLNRPTLNAFFDQVTHIFRNWPKDGPVMALYEIRCNLIGVNPFIRQRTLELHDVHVEVGLKVLCAIVVQSHMTAQVLNVFVRFLADKLSITRCFGSYNEAVAWLESNLQ